MINKEWFFMPKLNTWLFVMDIYAFSVITHMSQSVSLSWSCPPDPDRLTWFSLDRAGLTHRALHLSDVGETLSLALHQLHHSSLSLHVTNAHRVSRKDVAPGQNYIIQSQNTDRRHLHLRLVVLLHSEIPVNQSKLLWTL